MNNKSQIVYNHWILFFWFIRLNLGSSFTFPLKQTTQVERQDLASQDNNSEIPLAKGNSDDKPINLITLVLPKGEVKIGVNNRQGNESREHIERLLESLKGAIYRLGYSLQISTSESYHTTFNGTKTTPAGSTWKTYHAYQGAKDLNLNDTDGTEAEDNAIYESASTTGLTQTYTEYEESYGYNYYNQSLNSDSESVNYAYPVDEELDDDEGSDYTDGNDEEHRSNLGMNGTARDKYSTENPTADNYDSYMAPAEQEYENFGKAPVSSASCKFVGSYPFNRPKIGFYLFRNVSRFCLFWILWTNKSKYL